MVLLATPSKGGKLPRGEESLAPLHTFCHASNPPPNDVIMLAHVGLGTRRKTPGRVVARARMGGSVPPLGTPLPVAGNGGEAGASAVGGLTRSGQKAPPLRQGSQPAGNGTSAHYSDSALNGVWSPNPSGPATASYSPGQGGGSEPATAAREVSDA